MDKFKTISENSTGQIEEKKSRFIANIFYVEDITQIEEIIKKVKKKYYDAKHNCYAYRVIQKEADIEYIREKSSDDGEPGGTAGAPILNVLKTNELLNVLVIVTRYFGGILLGTGGLVRAYSEATSKALEQTQFIILEKGIELQITVQYKDLEKLKHYCKKNNIEIVECIYENNIQCILKTNDKEKESLLMDNNINILQYDVLKDTYIKNKI